MKRYPHTTKIQLVVMLAIAALAGRTTLADPTNSESTAAGTAPVKAKAMASTIFEEKWDGIASVAWLPKAPSTEVDKGIHVAKITTSKAGESNVVQVVLLPRTFAGKWVTVTTRVKGDKVSTRPNPYNGPKVGFHFKNAEGVDSYPQSDALPDGTFDWMDVKWRVLVPSNVASGEFGIGLENVQGTLLVAPISITAAD